MKCFPVFFIMFLLGTCYVRGQESPSVVVDSLIQLPVADSLVKLPDVDSLIHLEFIDSLNRKVSTTGEKFTALKDSLNNISQPLDSLLSTKPLTPITHKVDAAKLKITAFVDSLRKEVEIPDSIKKLLPEEANLLENQELPNIGAKELDEVQALEELEALDAVKQVGVLEEMPVSGEINPLKEAGKIEGVEKVTDKTRELKEITNKAENLSETAENEVKKTRGFQQLEHQKGALDEPKKVLEQHGDEDYYKEKAVNTVKEKAKNHFEGHMDKLHAAQEKLAKIKKKYPEGVSSIQDLPKRRPNAMKGKPFKERLLLGLNIQVHPAQTPNIDLSPFVAYKLLGRLSLGLGGNYRLMTRDNFKGFTREGAVYGYRGFAEFKIHKGVFVHAGYELMKSPQRDSLLFKSGDGRKEKVWVDGLMMGLGKDYKIAQYIKGNMQVLYNLLDETNSPYQNKVMIRFGFSFQLKEKLKRPKIPKINKKDTQKDTLEKSESKAERESHEFLKKTLK